MRRIKILLFSISVPILFSFPVLAESVYTLDSCIEQGLKNNPAYKSAQLMVDIADQEKNSARGQFLPSLSTDYSYSNIRSKSASGPTDDDFLDQNNSGYSVRLSQVLYAGSRIFNTYTRADAQKEMYIAQEQFSKLELIYKIEAAFFQLKKAEQDVAVGVDTVKRLNSSLKSAEAYFKREMAPYVQVLLAKVDLANAEQELSIIRNTVGKKREELFRLMNIAADPDTSFSGGLSYYSLDYSTSYEECWKKASEKRTDLKSFEKQIVMSEKDAAIAAGKYLPLVRLDGGYYDQLRDYSEPGVYLNQKYDRDQENAYWKAGVSVSWQLFDGGSAWFDRKKSLLQIEKIREQIKDAENNIRSGIRTGLFSLSEAEQRIKSTSVAVAAAKETYESEVKRFQAGIATIPSVLDAQARVTRADSNYSQALLDYQIARAGINFLTAETNR